MKKLSAQQLISYSLETLKPHSNRIAVIDLDSTLYNVSGRQVQIFKEFAADTGFQKRFPNETKALQKIQGDKLAYYPVDCLYQLGLKDIAPDFSSVYHEFWYPRFFSNDYLIYDEVERGGAKFLTALEVHGFQIVFLTGRDVARMGEGTKAQLKRDSLLFPPRKLILKPHLSQLDHEFKADIAKDLCADNAGLIFIDNEAKNLNHLHRASLPVVNVFFDTVHSGKEEPLQDLILLDSFVLDSNEN